MPIEEIVPGWPNPGELQRVVRGRRTHPVERLPAAAFDALVERVTSLDEPWDAAVIPPGDDPADRMTVFGSGSGLLTFHADDTAEIIRIFDIAWIGP